MTPGPPSVDPAGLEAWCTEHLGSTPGTELFRSGHLSAVVGVRLVDAREIVVKVRPPLPRTAGCAEVQRRLFDAGYPCPEPLAGPAPLGDDLATAEAYLPGGAPSPNPDRAAQLSARAFARLVRLAPDPVEIPSLAPAPSWAAWDHREAGLWPQPEGADINLNTVEGPAWLDRAARAARDRLRAGVGPAVVGHCDWLVDNVRWQGDELLVVHDWDSAIVDSEAVLVGFAAALYSTGSSAALPTVADTDRFLAAYDESRGELFSADDRECAWAAGVWTRACDAKEQHLTGQAITFLSRAEAEARLRRAGTP